MQLPLWLFVFLLACRYFLFPFLLEFVKEIGNIRKRKYSEIGNIRVLAINVCLVFIFVFTLQERPSELKKTDNPHNFTLYHKKLILWVWRSSKVIKFTSPTFVIIFMIRRHRNLSFLHLPTLIFFWPWFFIPSVQT